eukprot:9476762-Pyramimonas_sp.AAC.1
MGENAGIVGFVSVYLHVLGPFSATREYCHGPSSRLVYAPTHACRLHAAALACGGAGEGTRIRYR